MTGRRWLLVSSLAGVVIVAVAVAAVAITYEEPQVVSIDNRWGRIADETSTIDTSVTIENPNLVPIPPILTLEYDVYLNSVRVATATAPGIGLPRGRSSVDVETGIDNSKISAWWRTHVERNERSTMRVDPRVVVRWIGVTVDLPEEREAVDTGIIDSLNDGANESGSPLGTGGVVLDGVAANWGRPSEDRTPITIGLSIDNRLAEAATVTDIRYRIVLNDITVGSDEIDRVAGLPADETTDLRFTLYIENARMNDWWVTHLRRGEVTNVSIELGGTLAIRGRDVRYAFDVPVRRSTIETDILGRSADA